MYLLKDRYRLLPVILVMGGIFYLSHQPGDSFSLPEIVNLDKLLHGLVYAVLGLAALCALPSSWRQQHPLAVGGAVVLFCLLYGISDEFHQSFIPRRSCDIFDVVADASGGLLALLCAWCWRRWRVRKRGNLS